MSDRGKFRGLRVDNGEEIKGYYLVSDGEHYIIDCSGVTLTAIALNDHIGGFPGYHEVHPHTVGQYRGIDDKDIEIYDGSLITFIPKDGSTTTRQTAEVYYCRKREMTCVKSGAWDCPLYNCKDIEVIGTIHGDKQ